MAIDREEKIRMQNLKERRKVVQESRQERQMKRQEHQEFGARPQFERWRSQSVSAAPLRFGETVGARFLSPGKLRAVPKIKQEPLGGMKKFGRDVERKKAQLYFR